ncbi:spore germination protein [Neobacillus niacini]|uniref:spore germination protein n=1 Tax=Neobacillus niacini TaxID=86668 RepID=UPI003983BC05
MVTNHNNVSIGTISGGIVNFGGAIYISPISITKTISGSGENNTSPDSEMSSEMDTENEPIMKFPKRC